MSATQKTKFTTKYGAYLGPFVGVGALLLLMMFQGGFFATGQILPGINLDKPQDTGVTFAIAESTQPDYYRAIGTVRSRNEVDIMPRIIARIVEIKVRSGDSVKVGDVLAILDAQDLSAGVAQIQDQLRAANAAVSAADEQVKSARAVLDLAAKDLERNKSLFEKNAISRRDYDQAISAHKQAEAGLQQASQQRSGASASAAAVSQGIRQAQAGLGYATLISPIDAVVAERLADPGDLGNPASVILKLFDPETLLLEVPVRESLVREVAVGSNVEYEVPALKSVYQGTVREIVPSVDPQSRTFLVKVCIDNPGDLIPGMFGTIKIPLKSEKKVIIIPESAIIKTGQLESVVEVINGRLLRRQIRSIDAGNGMREVLSGLKAGQIIQGNPRG